MAVWRHDTHVTGRSFMAVWHHDTHVTGRSFMAVWRDTHVTGRSFMVVCRGGGGGGRTRSKCHMTSITLLTCHSAITSGGAWLGTVLASTQYSGSVVGKVWHVRQLRTIAR